MMLKGFTSVMLMLAVIVALTQCKSNEMPQDSSILDGTIDSLWTTFDSVDQRAFPEKALSILAKIEKLGRDRHPQSAMRSIFLRYNIMSERAQRREIDAEDPVNFLFGVEALEDSVGSHLLSYARAVGIKNYYSGRRNTIDRRADLLKTEKRDSNIKDWTRSQFLDAIGEYSQGALHPRLKEESNEDWSGILESLSDTVVYEFRPTLYDVMAHTLTDLLTDASLLSIPLGEHPMMRDSIWWSNKNDFVNHDFGTDSSWLQQAIGIFQEALDIAGHPLVELDANLARLSFVRAHGPGVVSREKWETALLRLMDKYPQDLAQAQLRIKLAEFYMSERETLQKNGKTGYQKAMEFLREDHLMAEDHPWGQQARVLIREIERPHLSAEMESVVVPEEDILLHLRYRNILSFSYEVRAVDEEVLNRINRRNADEFEEAVNKQPLVEKGKYELPEKTQYSYHSVEVGLNPRKNGNYVVILRSGEAMFWQSFQVSDLAVVTVDRDIIVLDRNSGRGVEGAEVFLEEINWKSSDRRRFTLTSDTDGRAKWRGEENIKILEVKKGDRQLQPGLTLHSSSERTERNERVELELYTDRSIYRSAQIIYFKGIALRRSSALKESVVAGQSVELTLRDPNGETLNQQILRTDELGAIQGEFILPEESLTGQYTLSSAFGSTSIRLEDYRRPSFEVKSDWPDGAKYQLGDTVKLDIDAQTYSGFPMTGARITYSVYRTFGSLYPRAFSYPPQSNQSIQVAQGQGKLGTGGTFQIAFATEESPAENTLARYEIQCEVMDVAGETQSIKKDLNLSSSPFKVSVSLPNIFLEGDQSLEWRAENAMGESVSAEIQWSLSQLEGGEKKTIDRYWRTPDTILMSRSDFEMRFPHMSYFPNDAEQTKVERVVQSGSESIVGSEKLPTRFFDGLSTGRYRLDITDDIGTPLFQKTFEYLPKGKNTSSSQRLLQWKEPPTKLFAGESQTLSAIIPTDDSQIKVAVKKNDDPVRWESAPKLTVDASADDYGAVAIQMWCVKQNRFYSDSRTITIERPEKNLEIRTQRMRDKTKPGAEETYTFTVEGDQPTQLLASMYDASLDDIQIHEWSRLPLTHSSVRLSIRSSDFLASHFRGLRFFDVPRNMGISIEWPSFILKSTQFYPHRFMAMESQSDQVSMRAKDDNVPLEEEQEISPPRTQEPPQPPETEPVVRENLNETVFFFPKVEKNKKGEYEMTFTMNEALTEWKLQLLAHRADLSSGVLSKKVITAQNLSIRPFLPRILREGDTISLSARIEAKEVFSDPAEVRIRITDALTGADASSYLIGSSEVKGVDLEAGVAKSVQWRLRVPRAERMAALRIVMTVDQGSEQDGESHILPVLSNRVLVTSSLALEVEPKADETFDLEQWREQLVTTEDQMVLKYQLDVTKQPLWYAVQALPYISSPQNNSSSALVNRLFAHGLASEVARKVPQLKEQIALMRKNEQWESPLSQSQEWKNINLAHSPWVQAATKESDRMQRIEQLLDVNSQRYEQGRALRQLKDMQNADGGFAWMPGGPSSLYVSQYIAKELVRMLKMELISDQDIMSSLKSALDFCFQSFEKNYRSNGKKDISRVNSSVLIHTYFLAVEVEQNASLGSWEAWPEIKEELEVRLLREFSKLSFAQQALLGLAWNTAGKKQEVQLLVESLEERARKNDLLGWSWGSSDAYDFYYSALETQALIIEFLEEVGAVAASQSAKKWLLKNKQSSQWGNSKATAAAIHALLLTGDDPWIQTQSVRVDGEGKNVKSPDVSVGEWYVAWEGKADDQGKFNWPVDQLKIDNENPYPVWGSASVQYSSPLDQVEKSQDSRMKVQTEYYLQSDGPEGEQLNPVSSQTTLKKGDILVARVRLEVARAMDFVHLEQFRAASLEPIEQKSGYTNNGNVSFYQSIRDESTRLFIDRLPGGMHIFEYKERVAHAGKCTGGFTRVESFYAPEFKGHSSGQKIFTDDR
jgi:hypothetical protein